MILSIFTLLKNHKKFLNIRVQMLTYYTENKLSVHTVISIISMIISLIGFIQI